MNTKTITIATKNNQRRTISKCRLGWTLPPEEGLSAFVNGTGAKSEAKARWEEHGWKVSTEVNPHYTSRKVFPF